jgi:hypothetical protein
MASGTRASYERTQTAARRSQLTIKNRWTLVTGRAAIDPVRWTLPILLVACTTQTDVNGPGARRRCSDLEGMTFASLTQGECGLGSNGPTSCTWHISFATVDDFTSSYRWQHSDVEESGDVSCAGNAVADVSNGSAAQVGTYDASTQQLVWQGVTYAL